MKLSDEKKDGKVSNGKSYMKSEGKWVNIFWQSSNVIDGKILWWKCEIFEVL